MDWITLENLVALLMLIMLQAVLGFDNLLYIALESQRAPAAQQSRVRTLGIAIAVLLRIALLFLLIKVIDYFQSPLFALDFGASLSGTFNLHALIVLAGGAFIMYTATREIFHMMHIEEEQHRHRAPKSAFAVISLIVAMNVVFSFDSILSAMALTDVFPVMATAIVVGGLLMIVLADRVTEFLKKNRMYEVLGLFVLFIVGIMLLSEGGHLADMMVFGGHITPMSKSTFYFVIVVLVLVDIVQSRYRRKLMLEKASMQRAAAVARPQ